MFNKVTLIGNLGKDPELRYTPSGTAVANFSMATSRSWKGKDGEKHTETEWHRITVWGGLAEIAGEYLKKGSRVLIEGRIHYDSYEKDDVKRYTTEIIASDLRMMDRKSDQQDDLPSDESKDEVPY